MRAKYPAYSCLCTLAFALLAPSAALAKDYLDESRAFGPAPQSTTERLTFILEKDGPYPYLEWSVHMTQGRALLRILDPSGRRLNELTAQDCTLKEALPDAKVPGAYIVQLDTTDAVGQSRVRIYGGPAPPPKHAPTPALASAMSMMFVAVASVWFWRRRTGVAWRWFWVGATVWTVAVIVKFAIAIPFNTPLLDFFKSSLPHWAYLTTGSIYGGVMTGITEILFTLIAALIWRSMAATAARAVAIGIGAGAFEAAMVAITAVAIAVATGGGATTWSAALVPVAERIMVILCHTASRTLVLLAVARHRPTLFWYGFLLLSGADAVAMLFYLTGQIETMSPWLMEASFLPFALISIPITIWCVRHWPADSPRTVVDPQTIMSPSLLQATH